MNLNLEWLKSVLDTNCDIFKISDKLNEIGLEVENKVLNKENFEKIVVAKILKCEKHPDSDHLKVCEVSDGNNVYQIVCGAPNARAGIKVALALVGANIPYGNFKIKKSKIRGVDSCGMMCSEREMCLSNEHDGIIELPEKCEIGKSWFDEYNVSEKEVIEVSITPNRGDAASIYGIARDLAACDFGKLKELDDFDINNIKLSDIKINETLKNTHSVDVKIDNCVYFCREIKNINTNVKTPQFILKRNALNGCGDNGIIVNILNYIMFTYGQPMHSYDLDKVGKNIIIDYAKNESFLTLKGNEIKYDKRKILTVSDENKDLCIAGIIGGDDCKTTSETKNILLESAYFPTVPITIAGQELKITSDARFRYERGIDPDLTNKMLDLATKMITIFCGGEVSNVVSDGKINDNKTITYPLELTNKILGFEIPTERVVNILEKLQFKILDKNEKELKIQVPYFRHDIEIKEDISEELARIEGLDKVPFIKYEMPNLSVKNFFNQNIRARKLLASMGLKECVSMSFCCKNKAELFSSICDDLCIVNPISDDLNYMRPSLLVNLLKIVAKNESQILENQLAFFEEGIVFKSPNKDGQHNSIAGVLYGKAIQSDYFKETRNFDVFDAKRLLFKILEDIYNIKNVKVTNCSEKYTHPTRSFCVKLRDKDGEKDIAYFGEISPFVLKAFDLKNSVYFFELFTNKIPVLKKKQHLIEDILQQPVVRDISFVVDKDVSADKVLEAYKNDVITNIKVVDIFDLQSTDKKSISLRYVFESKETMTIEQINSIMDKIIEAVESKTKGKVRNCKIDLSF